MFSEKKLKQLAQLAYVYYYPLVSMEMTRLQFMYTPVGLLPGAGPLNTIGHFRKFPTADVKTVVRVNFDTLYSTGFFDVTNGPIVLSIGENTDERYFELPLYDMWTDTFAIPGSRVNGFGAKNFLLMPIGWEGDIPDNVEPIIAPTNYVWLIGRIQANGNNDTTIHSYQDTVSVLPLENWLSKEPYTPAPPPAREGVDIQTPVTLLVNAMEAEQFYNLAMEALVESPPHYTDWSTYTLLQQLGIKPGATFDQLAPEVQQVLKSEMKHALADIEETSNTIGYMKNGWQIYNEVMGVYGNEYMKRAVIALVGLGANPPEEAMYPFSTGDANGDPLFAEHQYVMRFKKGEYPPVDAFWSLTLYDTDGYQVENEIDRFAIGDRDDLYYEDDGTLIIYIQKDRPDGDKARNWLPTSQQGEFNITFRLYAPRKEVTTLKWIPPVIEKTS